MCGRRVARRTVVVDLLFPEMLPSASLSQGTVFVARFADGYHVWSIAHERARQQEVSGSSAAVGPLRAVTNTYRRETPMRRVVSAVALAASVSLVIAAPVSADQVTADDQIVQGSSCVGLDCVVNESFGFDTLRLKENNLRIKFDDTSNGSFPNNDWALQANETPSGGASRFMLFDDTAGRAPVSVYAGAPANALVITAAGEVRAARFLSQAVATENPAPADATGVLEALRTVDLSTSTFAADPAAPRHLSPTAHDFHLAFGLGADDGTVAPADMAGVALAAVKALDARVSALHAGQQGPVGPAGVGPQGAPGPKGPRGSVARWRIRRLERRNQRLKTRVERLERQMSEVVASMP